MCKSLTQERKKYKKERHFLPVLKDWVSTPSNKMKSILLSVLYLASASIQALEYEPQFENDQICVAKAKIQPHEEIGLHRDAYPQVVIALKGGTITRLEADGRITEVRFPTGVAVIREA